MAKLIWQDNGAHWVLRSFNTLGRGPECNIRLSATSISSFHAMIYWHAGRCEWRVRDIGSRNSTFVLKRSYERATWDKHELTAGQEMALCGGDQLEFPAPRQDSSSCGPPDVIQLALDDGAPPPLTIEGRTTDALIRKSGETIVLPDGDDEATVYVDERGQLTVETMDSRRVVDPGGFDVSGVIWRATTFSVPIETESATRFIFVSKDNGRHFEISIAGEAKPFIKGSEGCAPFFYALAIARDKARRDADRDGVSDGGWRDIQDQLDQGRAECKQRVNTWIYRIRQAFIRKRLCFLEPIERLDGAGVVRLGEIDFVIVECE